MNFHKESIGTVGWGCGEASALQLASVNESGTMRLFQLNPLQKQEPFVAIGEANIGRLASTLIWSEPAAFETGLLGVASTDGFFSLFDVKAVCEGKDAELGKAEVGGVVAGEFCPSKPACFLLGGDGAIVVDCEKDFANPAITRLSDATEKITSVSWNKGKAVPHILAYSLDVGRINVFDLKMKKVVSSFKDLHEHAGRRVHASWNPNNPLQLAAAFDDAESAVQIWDLRNAKAPVKRLNTGVTVCLDWSPFKTGTLLLAGEKGHFVELNYETDESRKFSKPNFDTSFARFLPRVEDSFYAVSHSNELEVFCEEKKLKSIAFKTLPKSSTPQPAAIPIGHKLLYVPNKAEPFVRIIGEEPNPRLFSLAAAVREDLSNSQVVADHFRQNHDPATMGLILNSEKQTEEKLDLVGLCAEDIIRAVEHINSTSYSKKEDPSKKNKKFKAVSETEMLDFFSELAQEKEKTPNEHMIEAAAEDVERIELHMNHNFKKGFEKLMRECLILNLPEAAVDCAIRANRIFEAFAIANNYPVQRDALIARISAKVAAAASADVTNMLKLTTLNADSPAVSSCFAPAEWKEMAAFVIKKARSAKERETGLQHVIDKLAEEESLWQEYLHALLLANKFELFLEQLLKSYNGSFDSMLSFFELALLIYTKTKIKPKGAVFTNMLHSLCSLLIEIDRSSACYALLTLFGDDTNDKLLYLKYNVYYCFEEELKPLFAEPTQLNKKNFNFPLRKKKGLESSMKKERNAPGAPPVMAKPAPARPPEPTPDDTHARPVPVSNPFSTKPAKPEAPKMTPVTPNIPVTTPSAPATAPVKAAPVRPNIPVPPPKMANPPAVRTPVMAPPPSMPPAFQPKPEVAHPHPPADSQSFPPSASHVPVPPPPPKRTVPPPPPKAVPPPPPSISHPHPPALKFKYDAKKTEEVIEFIKRGPSFVSEIEKNPQKAKEMVDSLTHLEHTITAGSLPNTVFDGFLKLVELMGEDKIDEAKSLSNILGTQLQGEDLKTLSTIKRFLSVL